MKCTSAASRTPRIPIHPYATTRWWRRERASAGRAWFAIALRIDVVLWLIPVVGIVHPGGCLRLFPGWEVSAPPLLVPLILEALVMTVAGDGQIRPVCSVTSRAAAKLEGGCLLL